MMLFPAPLIEGKLVKRYKRFLADVITDRTTLTVHCPNSGSMAGLLQPGGPVRISGPHSPNRKYPFTLEQIRIRRPDKRRIWVGVNTAVPNRIVREALEEKRLPGFEMYNSIRAEVPLGGHSRIDFMLESPGRPRCWIEVKNVTLVLADPRRNTGLNEGDCACFPDAITVRGTKHLRELAERARAGERAAMVFVVQRSDGRCFSPASGIDPVYAEELAKAREAGVELMAVNARVDKRSVRVAMPIPVFLPTIPD